MEPQEHKKRSTGFIVLYFYIVLLLLLLLTVSSYTWFSLSKTPRVSNMSMYINAPAGLKLALDPDSEAWELQLSYLDMVPETSVLRPVTWSENDQMFYAAVYGADGRLTGEWHPLTDERNANRNNYEGYYCIGTFYARTEESVTVSLSSAVEVEEGVSGSGTYLIGTPVWDAETLSHTTEGDGAETAVRVGIKVTRLDGNKDPIENSSQFYIYEPNCDIHIDGSVGYVPTPSIDGTATLIPEDRLITQTASYWQEADPVEKDVQIHTFGNFTSPAELFTMTAGETVQLQLYVWFEGQDIDCNNAIEEALIKANIQFLATADTQSGLTPFED